jgi:transposase|tara:strand:- start:38 stop:910 length:873 start_codon:yes stop_codon:yes gene_type:complete
VVVQIKALACELPSESGIPLSRFSSSEIAAEAVRRGYVAKISGATVWRWLNEDAIRPWHHRSWIFPKDPDFEIKAGRVLDLYHRQWQGKRLGPREYVLSADEKTSIQARARKHDILPPGPNGVMRVEHEYERKGALAYLAALDVHDSRIFGRCEPSSGIEPFDRLLSQIMNSEPYGSAERVFLIVDNGSSHRGEASINRIQGKWPRLQPVHLPVHASWLNQIEIYFSILKRKALTPVDFASLEDLKERILGFQERYTRIVKPFEWKFTRADLTNLMAKLSAYEAPLAKSA